MPKNTPSIDDSRIKTISFTIIFAFIVVIFRLFYHQVVNNSKINSNTVFQNSKLKSTLPSPGKILSSDNFPLSLGIKVYKVSVYKPNLTISVDELIKKIIEINPEIVSKNTVQIKNLQNPSIKWITLNGFFSQKQKDDLSIQGIEYEQSITRFYPENNLAKNIITNLETYYKRSLNGKIGFSLSSVDGTGQSILTRRNWRQLEIDGIDIKTSLNRQIQFILDNSLKSGLEKYQAQSASGTIIDPKTGNIIAMSYIQSDTSPVTNIGNIGNLFEPGSIFKPIVVAIGLDSKKINEDFICNDCDKPKTFGQYTINNWDNTFHPNSNLKDIIKNSDNVGMSSIISQIGKDTFQDYYHRLKLDSKNEIDLMGESISPKKKYYSDIDLATASFGQGLAVNEIQIVQAFNTLANQGNLISAHFNINLPIKPTKIFSPNTTSKVVDILKYAVENGAINYLKPKNLEVCAKSGTAQIAIDGQYNETNTIGSYIGFSPCNEAKFTMIITVNQPKNSQYGSSTAAPIWFEIAEKLSALL